MRGSSIPEPGFKSDMSTNGRVLTPHVRRPRLSSWRLPWCQVLNLLHGGATRWPGRKTLGNEFPPSSGGPTMGSHGPPKEIVAAVGRQDLERKGFVGPTVTLGRMAVRTKFGLRATPPCQQTFVSQFLGSPLVNPQGNP